MSIQNGIVALKYKDGVIIGSDTQLHYGSFTKYVNVDRHFDIGPDTTVATSGYWADTQFMVDDLKELEREDALLDDGRTTSAKGIHAYLKLVTYQKRCDFNPALISVVVAGKKEGEEPFLGWVDSVGSYATTDMFATGLAHHLCIPVLREAAEDGKWKNLTREDATAVVKKCLGIAFLRGKPTCARCIISDTTDGSRKHSEPFMVNGDSSETGVIKFQQQYWGSG